MLFLIKRFLDYQSHLLSMYMVGGRYGEAVWFSWELLNCLEHKRLKKLTVVPRFQIYFIESNFAHKNLLSTQQNKWYF